MILLPKKSSTLAFSFLFNLNDILTNPQMTYNTLSNLRAAATAVIRNDKLSGSMCVCVTGNIRRIYSFHSVPIASVGLLKASYESCNKFKVKWARIYLP